MVVPFAMATGKDGKTVSENSITPGTVHFALDAATGTPASLSGDVAPKTSTPYPKENPDHQLSISRIASAADIEHKDGPAAKRRREVF